MEIRIKKEELAQHRLFIGTPMYGGQCTGIFARSMSDLSAVCTHMGMQLQLFYLMNESLITRARNYVCDEFVRSNSTHLMFIDSDIGFDARDVIALMALSIQQPEYDIIGGPYPKKTISWEKVKQAVDKGLADPPLGTPQDLEKYIGDYVFNPKAGQHQIQINEPAEVLEVGTGFMMIRRNTFEKFKESYGERYDYRPDHVRTEHFDGTRKITQYFQAEIDAKSERYLSEDYWFTQKCQDIGMKTWLCPWMKLQHMGSYTFSGSLADLAAAGAAATADMGELNKSKPKKKK